MSGRSLVVLGLLVVGCGETVSVGTSAPTYHAAIAPMLAEQCVGCHGEADAIPLHDYSSVSARRLDVLASLVDGSMPPWGDPDPRCLDLDAPATPTGADVLRFRGWALGGAAEGSAPSAPPEPLFVEEPAVRADVSLDADVFSPPTRPHTQCFLLDEVTLAETRITAARLRTTRPDLVRWVELADSALSVDALIEIRDGDPDPGWHCPFPNRYRTHNTLVLWPGGETSVRHAEGTGTVLDPGRRLVLRVHYDATTPFEDRVGVDLEVDASARAARIISHEPVRGTNQTVQAGLLESSFAATVEQTSTMPRTVHAIAPGLESERAGRVRVARLAEPDACFIDVARGARRTWFPVTEPFRMESSELLEITCSYDTRADTTDVDVGLGDGHLFCGAHFYVTPWMPSDG